MDRKTPRPRPFRLVQPTESRRYITLDAHSSLSSPAYSFEPQPALQEDHSAWQLLHSLPLVQVHPHVVLSRTVNHHWNDSVDSHLHRDSFHSSWSSRSSTPPIRPPVSSPRGQDAEHSYKRHGRTFALVPAEVNGEHVFTHIALKTPDNNNDPKQHSSHSSIPPEEDGLPEDMQDMLRQLDDLASWVKAASSNTDCFSDVTTSAGQTTCPTGHPAIVPQHPSQGLLLDKGKNRLLSSSLPCSESGIPRNLAESSRSAGNPTTISPDTVSQSEGFIYMPTCDTPEFLVGSSSSPVAYPVCGYSSHPSRCPHHLDPTRDIPHHRRFLERRSAPCPPPISPLISPPLGKTSFKALFQRSRCNTTTALRPSIPSSHVPVNNALRQGKRVRLAWLRI